LEEKETASPAHTEESKAVITIAGTTVGTILTVSLLEVAVRGDAQLELDVITQFTISPLFKLEEENVAPTALLVPFTFHWYVGAEPPLVGVALKSTEAPWHKTPAVVVVTFTAGAELVMIDIVSEFEAAVGLTAQPALEVSTQVTTAPFVKTLEEKVLPFPAFAPFTFH
jgi:hypothetical protein